MKSVSIHIVDSGSSCAIGMKRGSKIRVLHVDDDDCILRISKAILEMNGGYQVETVSSVYKAYEKMDENEYDAVISDYHMPEKDGLQFLKELREKGNRISFILFSGEKSDEARIEALGLGADGYFSKTGSPETVYKELSHGIESAIERARLQI